jgi:hypothetical protein
MEPVKMILNDKTLENLRIKITKVSEIMDQKEIALRALKTAPAVFLGFIFFPSASKYGSL